MIEFKIKNKKRKMKSYQLNDKKITLKMSEELIFSKTIPNKMWNKHG